MDREFEYFAELPRGQIAEFMEVQEHGYLHSLVVITNCSTHRFPIDDRKLGKGV